MCLSSFITRNNLYGTRTCLKEYLEELMKRKLLILFVGVKSRDPSYLAKALDYDEEMK